LETQEELKFIRWAFKNFARRKIKNILDIACGTGRHAIPLAKLGYRVTAFDLSKEMLDIAKEKAKKENVRIEFKQEDMKELEHGKNLMPSSACSQLSITC
jgi:2-polyprenyl-3-methyl-5-hydroxy-6-metoxy-1,4-benzoquinol methylase